MPKKRSYSCLDQLRSELNKISPNVKNKAKGDDPCWDGYEMVGKKKKGGKTVPNCVPKKNKKKMQKQVNRFNRDETSEMDRIAWNDQKIKYAIGTDNVEHIENFFGEKAKEPGFWNNIVQSVLLSPSKLDQSQVKAYYGRQPYDNHLYHNGESGVIYEESGDRSPFFDAPMTSQLKDMDQTKPFLLLQHGTGTEGNQKAKTQDPSIYLHETNEGHPMSYDHFGSGIFYHDKDGNLHHYANYQLTHPLSSDRGSLLVKSVGFFDTMRQLGVKKIHTMPTQSDNSGDGRAGRLGQWSGGRIWPRMGFNSPLPKPYIDRMPDSIKMHPGFKSDTLSLMQVPGGEKYYEQNPLFLHHSEFDLDPESENSKYFNQKWGKHVERAKRQKGGQSSPSRNQRKGKARVQQFQNRLFAALVQAIAFARNRRNRKGIGAGAGNQKSRQLVQFKQTKQEQRSLTSLANAIARLHSANERYYRDELAQVLARTGLKPHRIHSVLHDTPKSVKPAVAASILRKVKEDQADYAAAWHGMLSKQTAMMIFHSHPEGADSLYRLKIPSKPEPIRQLLNDLGIQSRILIPRDEHTETLIHDPGREYRKDIHKLAVGMKIPVEEMTGQGKILGGKDMSQARAKYRDIIRQFESSSPSV